MLGNVLCWVIALALILSDHAVKAELYTKLAFALGFIFLGICSKAVDVYHDLRKKRLVLDAAKVVGGSKDK